jgi:hypothetical protein
MKDKTVVSIEDHLDDVANYWFDTGYHAGSDLALVP